MTNDLESTPIKRNVFLMVVGIIICAFLAFLSFVAMVEIRGFFVSLMFLLVSVALTLLTAVLLYCLFTENLQVVNPKKHIKNLKNAKVIVDKMPLDLTSSADKLLAQSLFVQVTNFSNKTNIFRKEPYVQLSKYASEVLRVNAFNETSTQREDIKGRYSENLCIAFVDLQKIVL